ncbi:uncharacterized protein LOC129910071 [Episyrphus balteatus]|uniref:uncharacterized protein LOC129910071 n=1 Tax=Episyrphus balteatus TaxID=286459 RepID=UPI002485F6F7|nr:uncharacterized protein LOC129910071 [Episyrphus balteatus]
MNLNYYQFIVFIAFLSQLCSASKFNTSQSKLEKSCDVYLLLEREYGYKDFFEVSSMKENLKKDNERLHLKFYVMTWSDADIFLSENNNNDHIYEIALGVYRNTLSTFNTRYAPGSDLVTIVEKSSPNMLSTFDPVLVEIIQTNDGEVIVNIPGYAEPLMKYLDANPLNIKLFSFSTWGKTPAKWFYNCQFDENSNMESQKNNEEQLFTSVSKLSPTDPGVFNKHKSFFHSLVPTLDKFDDDQVMEFQQGVIEVMKKVKKTSSTTEKPKVRIDVRSGW